MHFTSFFYRMELIMSIVLHPLYENVFPAYAFHLNAHSDVTMDVYNHLASKQDIKEEVERYEQAAGN